MDKRVIFAVAGSGKTTHIVDSLSKEKRSLIVTYTVVNKENLRKKIEKKYNGVWPDNITLMTYFSFLFRFCYKPFMADLIPARGVVFDKNPDRYAKKDNIRYYMSDGGYFYSNRLSMILQKNSVMDEIKNRITKYFDEFIIDEVQDIAGRDFTFLEKLMDTDVNQLFVGDFYQHTYDTSRDGNVNKTLFNNRLEYEQRFINKGFLCDSTSLVNSWRCSKTICQFIVDNLGIEIYSNRSKDDDTEIKYINDSRERDMILLDSDIVKLHYSKGTLYGLGHYNWGEMKGEDKYNDVCVFLNKTTAKVYDSGKLQYLAPSTRNKLYVAITRAHGNVYFVKE